MLKRLLITVFLFFRYFYLFTKEAFTGEKNVDALIAEIQCKNGLR